MPRLPIPGSDDGVWGGILNEFLSVEHAADGTLKPSGSLSTKADDSATVHTGGNETISGTKIFNSSPVVPTPTLVTQAANKAYVDNTVSAGAVDATATTKGIVQLAGDLAGTAAAPTVPALGTKENAVIAGTTDQYYRGDKTFQTLPTTLPPNGVAGGDLTGTYPNPTLAVDRIPKDIVTIKGDLIAATASATLTRLGVGSNGQVLTADSTQASGLKWATSAAGGAVSFDSFMLMGA